MSPSAASCATECRVVRLLAGVKARVLQAENVAGLHRVDRGARFVADAILGEGHGPLEHVGDRRGEQLERLRRIEPFRAAEMGDQDYLAALVGDLPDGGATRSIRVVSATLPFSTGTLRSTRTSTRLPLTST